MNRRNRLLAAVAGIVYFLLFFSAEEITVQAGEKEGYDFPAPVLQKCWILVH